LSSFDDRQVVRDLGRAHQMGASRVFIETPMLILSAATYRGDANNNDRTG